MSLDPRRPVRLRRCRETSATEREGLSVLGSSLPSAQPRFVAAADPSTRENRELNTNPSVQAADERVEIQTAILVALPERELTWLRLAEAIPAARRLQSPEH